MIETKRELGGKRQRKEVTKDLIRFAAKKGPLAERKHRQIVDGACKVLFKKGFHPTSIREIANACNMSTGQLYHYISSKDDVLYLVHKHLQKVWYDHLKYPEIEQVKDPLRKLIKAIDHTLEFMVENRHLLQFVYTESKHLDKEHLRAVLEMDFNDVICFWRGLLEALSKRSRLKGDLDCLASLVTFNLAFLPLRGWTVRNKPIDETNDSIKEFLLRGLGITKLPTISSRKNV